MRATFPAGTVSPELIGKDSRHAGHRHAAMDFQRNESVSPYLPFPFSSLRADRRDALSHFGCGFVALWLFTA